MAIVSSQQRTPEPDRSTAGDDLPLRRLKFRAMATDCELQYAAPGGDAQAAAFEKAAEGWVHAFEAKYSRFQPASIVSRINAAAGREWVPVDAETEGMLSLCDTLHFMTRGILDPSALPLIGLWNWKAAPPSVPSAAAIAGAMRLVGWSKVRREPGRVFLPEPGMALDFGGFGKEYAVDIVSLIGKDHGIAASLVDFGHDIRAAGAPPGRPAWHIGLEDPKKPGTTWASIALTGRSVASSGDYIRNFTVDGRRYGHIIDPRTGWPVSNGCTQATVIADTCLQAGMLSTSAFIAGVDMGLELIRSCPGAEGIILTEKERAQTRGFFNYMASR
ncbi:MAG TPA: FAD:protein FMN transferase [Opitutaceae bacterium]|nr:FAD:protein FMN transferase [Opitutaceae bacterium]